VISERSAERRERNKSNVPKRAGGGENERFVVDERRENEYVNTPR